MSKKILYFEGAGCVPRGDVENCRIRTAFINDEGKKIYLEMMGIERNVRAIGNVILYKNIGFVDHCHYITDDKRKDDQNECRLSIERTVEFDYCKQEILNLINEKLHCSFEEMIVTDIFDGYHVHAKERGYNLMDDFMYRPEHAEKARKAFHKIDMEIREKLGEKYSKVSLHTIGDHAISVRCYASDKSMRKHGLDPDKRIMTVLI